MAGYNQCKVIGCNGKHKAFGYCDKHYKQYKKYGQIRLDLEYKKFDTCQIEGCTNKHHALGLCKAHYQRFIENRNINKKLISKNTPEKTCSIEGCNKKHYGKGLCVNHYMYNRRHGLL